MPQSPPLIPASNSPAKVDDAVLLRKIADGDAAALGSLFDQMARPVYSLVMQLVRSHDEAEDVVESTFWQAWQEAAQLLETPDLRSWLLVAGRRRALEHLRARRRQREELMLDKRQFEDLVSVSGGDSPEDEERRAFVQILRNLEPEERKVLELGYFRGLSQVDIADLTGDPPATVRMRMRAALTRLRRDETAEAPPE